eukprot:scaffold49387_cov72-Phaeocystis_antarctica.AAC.3
MPISRNLSIYLSIYLSWPPQALPCVGAPEHDRVLAKPLANGALLQLPARLDILFEAEALQRRYHVGTRAEIDVPRAPLPRRCPAHDEHAAHAAVEIRQEGHFELARDVFGDLEAGDPLVRHALAERLGEVASLDEPICGLLDVRRALVAVRGDAALLPVPDVRPHTGTEIEQVGWPSRRPWARLLAF